MSNPGAPVTIGAVAALAGKRPSSIRYYEQIGLLPRAARVSGRREFEQLSRGPARGRWITRVPRRDARFPDGGDSRAG